MSTKNSLVVLKENFGKDLISGFLVFLLALPLSLGIAKASGFPPAMGVLAAIIGGISGVFFRVSELSIKGPAAGLITICSAAVLEFGGTEGGGWQTACAIILIMALFQIAFGFLKFGSLSVFFPHSAVHGMLAAIGIIIIAKQIPVLLGDDPRIYKGETPLEMLAEIPRFVEYAHWQIAMVGILGLIILFSLPIIKLKIFKLIPAAMVVLVITIPIALILNFKNTEPSYSMVQIGDFWGTIGSNVDFSHIGEFAFWKYVLLFLFVSSLESLLTVKAVDNLDPEKRTANYNGDLVGQGAGNFLSGFLGGLPMISEVVRSTSNIGFGAKSKWSNFFHGFFLLLSMIFLIPLIEMIPNAALAAMLIFAGYKLAAPKEFIHTYHIGKEQLLIFIVTIVVTLVEDLLLGIAAGIIVKLVFHMVNGAKLSSLFKANYTTVQIENNLIVTIHGSAVFSNLIGYKRLFDSLGSGKNILVDLNGAVVVDHSFMTFIHHMKNEYNEQPDSGMMEIIGIDEHESLSDHPLATRVLKRRTK